MLRKHLKTDLLPLAIILLIPLIILDGALLHNQALLPTDILSAYPAWQGSFESQKVSNGLLSDEVLQFYPWRKLAYEELQATGHFPLWNPYELTGQPLVANAQSALYYPPNILLHWIRPEDVVAICAYFNLVLIGIFTFYFCREINLRKTASLFAAIIAMLSGPVIVWLGYPMVNSMASFPLMLLAGEKIINHRRLIPWIGALGAGIALSILGGHPETTINICLAFGLYFLFRLIVKKPGFKQALLCLGAVSAGVFVGLLLGAIQWVPFIESLLNSATLSEGGRSMGGTQLFYSGEWLYNLASGVTFLVPHFFGSPVTSNYLWPFPNYQNYNEQAIYYGLIPLAFSFSALFNRRWRSPAVILIGISLFYLAVAWRLPGFEVVNHIPPFSLLLNKRMKLFIPLMMAIVAGIGLNDWLDPEQSDRLRARNRIPVLLPPLFSLAIFAFIGIVNVYSPDLDIYSSSLRVFVDHLVYRVFNINQPRIMISFVVPLIFILLCLLNWRRIISHALFGYCVLTVTLIELVVLGWNYNPVTDRSLVYPEIPIVSLIRQESQPFRTLSTDLALFPPNAGAAYRIAQIEGYDYPVFQSEFDIYRAQGGAEPSHRQVWSINYPLVEFLNIRYVISSAPIQKNGYSLVLDQPSYKVYRNENAYPRATMVYDYQVIEDRAKLLQTMVSTPGILEVKVLFSQPPPNIPAVNSFLTNETPAKVEFLYYGMDRSVLNVNSARAGFLVMSDLYTKDWKATIDGVPTTLLNANYAYRAVVLPEGQHQVEFYYAPASFMIGKTLSLSGLIILIVLCISEVYTVKEGMKK